MRIRGIRFGRGLLVAAVSTGATLTAQGFEPFGQSFGGGDDSIVQLLLGFSFPMPDGSTVSGLDVDTNGRIGELGSLGSQPNEALSGQGYGLLTGPPTLCPFWTDLVDHDGLGNQIHFHSTSSVAVITWVDVAERSTVTPYAPFTMQVHLHVDGTIVFVYDSAMRKLSDGETLTGSFAGTGIVGFSGGGIPAPPLQSANSIDYSISDGVALFGTTHEWFVNDGTPGSSFDLASQSLSFTPSSPGYSLSVNTVASVARGRSACSFRPFGMTLQPLDTLASTYLVTDAFDPDMDYADGVALQFPTANPVIQEPLPFGFVMPGGAVVTSLDIDLNGRVATPGSIGQVQSATVGELLAMPGASLCPLWTTLESSGGAATVWKHDGPGWMSVTWEGFGQDGVATDNTFQLRIFADGRVHFAYLDLSMANDGGDCLVGLSSGNGATDPGEGDLSELYTFPVLTPEAVVYEFFDLGKEATAEVFDLDLPINSAFDLEVHSTPAIGRNLVVAGTDETGTASMVLFVIGYRAGRTAPFAKPFDMGLLGPQLRGCSFHVDAVTPGGVIDVVAGPPGVPIPLLSVPYQTSLVGSEDLAVQALVINLFHVPYITPTDELILKIGF